jgi:ABC-type spermidine/putrescine transport system permease subunit II
MKVLFGAIPRRFALIIFLTLAALPFASMLLWSFIARWPLPDTFPRGFSLQGWQYLFRSGDVVHALRGAGKGIIVGGVSCLLAAASARAMGERRGPWITVVESIFYLPLLVPVLSVVLGLHRYALMIFGNSFLPSLWLYVFFSFPYAFKIMYAAYQGGIGELKENAASLGLAPRQILCHVEIPVLLPHIIDGFTVAFAVAYGQYIIELFFSPVRSRVFMLQMADFLQNSNRNIAAVYSVFYTLLGLAVLLPTMLAGKRAGPEKGKAERL